MNIVLHVHLKLPISASRAWQRKLRLLIKSSNKEDEIYASLLSLLKEADSDRLTANMHLLVEKWQAKKPDFINYFQSTYISRKGLHIVYV